jgi:hypothetical protein
MTDFFDQARILAVIYESFYEYDPTKPIMSYRVLVSEKYFESMDAVDRLGHMLTYLLKKAT